MRFAKSLLFIFLLTVVPFCQSSKAEFVGNVERFDGTVKDTITWSEYLLNPGPSRITQNDAVTFDGSTDYCTNTITVGVGQIVQVDVTNVTDLSDSLGIFGLSLSGHNDGASSGNYLRMACVYNSSSDSWSLIAQHEMPVGGTANYFFGTTATPTFGTAPLVLEVERVSETMAYCRAYQGGLLGQRSITFTGVPEQLYIRLENSSFTTTFDNVTIIPEPATLLLFAGGSGLMRYYRKRRI
ncbi:MAG: PEP-CTERM sorting domain-containing protein [Planctomycetota bacterium]